MAAPRLVGDKLEEALQVNDEAAAGTTWLDVALDVLGELDGDDRVGWVEALLLTASTDDVHDHERSSIARPAMRCTQAQLLSERVHDQALRVRADRMLRVSADYQ